MKILIQYFVVAALTMISVNAQAQDAKIWGVVTNNGTTLDNISVKLIDTDLSGVTDNKGRYEINKIPAGFYTLSVSNALYASYERNITIKEGDELEVNINLGEKGNQTVLEDVVITGTMKPVTKLESPVPVEVYSQTFFQKNPTPNMFEAMQNINGVRPQVNCNVCNTGDIHINGLEGPYTMVLIDGMPIVSSLGTVYGLAGIPNSMIERIEVIKGPASSLYGSEAVGGLINVITKKPGNANAFSADVMGTTWQEYNVDLGFKFKTGDVADVLTGVNYYNYQNPIDNNNDQFTDVTLQHRISAFQKWNFNRADNKLFSIAGRYMYEDRWGGEMRWEPKYRGGDEVYGESIFTSRAELLGNYQLPVDEKMFLAFSYTDHEQDSRYGTDSYIATQKIGFGQLTWDTKIGKHDLLTGVALRYTYYNDNTPGTATNAGADEPENTWLPGVFVQDEINLAQRHKLLLGLRYDHNNYHGNIFTPRIAYKWTASANDVLRLNAGTGFRVVNLFTEDHAALTGARDVVILNKLRPEKSYNANLNYVKRIYFDSGFYLGLDASAFYTYFNNKIKGDFDIDPQKIIYDNIDGHAISKGISLNADLQFTNGLSFMAGATLMENTITNKDENGVSVTERPEFAENFTATWGASYKVHPMDLTIDYTGNLYSPMKLPLAGESDPRSPESPWWSIQNIQLTYSGLDNFEIYGGVKNLLNWTPADGLPFLISRTYDPFDKTYDENNPNDLSFSPEYVYAPNQGIRGFLGIRYNIK